MPMQAPSLCFATKVPLRVKSQQTNPTKFKDLSSMAEAAAPKWAQKTITLTPHKRGCHLITSKDLSGFKCGLAHLFLQHTSASLTINENYDSDVRDDTERFLNIVVPEGPSAPGKHTLEGPDDMPAHIKSSMFGSTLTIPVTNGKLNMGTWQDQDQPPNMSYIKDWRSTKEEENGLKNSSLSWAESQIPLMKTFNVS